MSNATDESKLLFPELNCDFNETVKAMSRLFREEIDNEIVTSALLGNGPKPNLVTTEDLKKELDDYERMIGSALAVPRNLLFTSEARTRGSWIPPWERPK